MEMGTLMPSERPQRMTWPLEPIRPLRRGDVTKIHFVPLNRAVEQGPERALAGVS